jgi:hypothetical protein
MAGFYEPRASDLTSGWLAGCDAISKRRAPAALGAALDGAPQPDASHRLTRYEAQSCAMPEVGRDVATNDLVS